jgi:hypothetical protein
MNKRNAVFMAILTFLSPAMTCAMNNDKWQNSDAADQLAVIYQADQLGKLHMVPNIQSSVIILQNHIKSLESQKSNYSGIFSGKIGTSLSNTVSIVLGIASILHGFNFAIGRNILNAYDYQHQIPTVTASQYRLIPEYFKAEAKKLWPSDYENLGNELIKSFIVAPLFALAAGTLYCYSTSKYDAVQKDIRLNAEIKRDQEIIEKLQAIQAAINAPYYQ